MCISKRGPTCSPHPREKWLLHSRMLNTFRFQWATHLEWIIIFIYTYKFRTWSRCGKTHTMAIPTMVTDDIFDILSYTFISYLHQFISLSTSVGYKIMLRRLATNVRILSIRWFPRHVLTGCNLPTLGRSTTNQRAQPNLLYDYHCFKWHRESSKLLR